MKIKNNNKTWFFISLIVTIGLIAEIIYKLINGEFSEMPWSEKILNILMLIVMSHSTIKFIEFKK